MKNEIGMKTKFIRWILAVMALWALAELGVTQLRPHIPWLVGLTFVWAVMLPLLDSPTVQQSPVFVRLMLAYVTSGLAVAAVAPFFFDVGDDWQASLIFYGAVISVSGLSFLVHRYGREWSDAGPAVGALMLAGLAMYLVRHYSLGYALLIELSIVFLLTVSATFCLFLLVSIAGLYLTGENEKPASVKGSGEKEDEDTDEFSPFVHIPASPKENDEVLWFGRIGSLTTIQMLKSIGSLLALLLLAGILVTLVSDVF